MQKNGVDQNVVAEVERTKWKRMLQTLAKDWRLYVLLIPMLAFVILFRYLPVYGILSGFKWDNDGNMMNSQWAGFTWLMRVFGNADYAGVFWRAFRNTFVNSMYGLIFGFPIPILLALCFSEIKLNWYRSIVQVFSYLPHFISAVVITQLIRFWCTGESTGFGGGALYRIFNVLGWTKADAPGKTNTSTLLSNAKFFRPIYQVSGVWEGAGYGSIVYFAAILAISPVSYEAARIDGASKIQQIRYVTFPGMAPTLSIMLIMRIGQILNIGYEKIVLLVEDQKDASTWETSDVISTYVYRMSGKSNIPFEGANQMVGIVMDLFNSIIAMILVLGANAISRRVSSTSLF